MYCKHCGKYLQDGEICTCEASRTEAKQVLAEGHSQPTQGQFFNRARDVLTSLLQYAKQYPKKAAIAGAVLLLVVILIAGLSTYARNKKVEGSWKVNPDSIGYGISMVIKNGKIEARGDAMNHFGSMRFKYTVVSDTEMILKYDWTFQEWIWNFPRANEIPVTYSISRDGTLLTLSWAGTDFVLLDNVTDFKNGFGSKSCLLMAGGGSVTLKKVK